jgi:hypothetical protein
VFAATLSLTGGPHVVISVIFGNKRSAAGSLGCPTAVARMCSSDYMLQKGRTPCPGNPRPSLATQNRATPSPSPKLRDQPPWDFGHHRRNSATPPLHPQTPHQELHTVAWKVCEASPWADCACGHRNFSPCSSSAADSPPSVDQPRHNAFAGENSLIPFPYMLSTRSTIRIRTYGSGVARCSSPAGTPPCYDGGAASGRPGKKKDRGSSDVASAVQIRSLVTIRAVAPEPSVADRAVVIAR